MDCKRKLKEVRLFVQLILKSLKFQSKISASGKDARLRHEHHYVPVALPARLLYERHEPALWASLFAVHGKVPLHELRTERALCAMVFLS